MTAPLTVLTEEERMFQGAVRDFAESEVRPRVHAMEEAAQLDPTLIPKVFELGLMGIETPEQHGGAGGSLFMTVLAVEELSAVDASAAIFVDVQNTLVNASTVDRKSTRLNSSHDQNLVCRLLLEKKK